MNSHEETVYIFIKKSKNNGGFIMIKYQKILGTPVMSAQEGKVLGKVVSELVDVEDAKVLGFTVEIYPRKKRILLLEDIKTFGKDAIVIPNEKLLRTRIQIRKEKKFIQYGKEIIGLKIITKGGKDIGEKLLSFHFKRDNGEITHYETSRSLLQDTLEGKGLLSQGGVVSIGPDALVVDEKAVYLSHYFKANPGLIHSAKQAEVKTKKEVKKAVKKVKKTAQKISKTIKSNESNIIKPKKRK